MSAETRHAHHWYTVVTAGARAFAIFFFVSSPPCGNKKHLDLPANDPRDRSSAPSPHAHTVFIRRVRTRHHPPRILATCRNLRLTPCGKKHTRASDLTYNNSNLIYKQNNNDDDDDDNNKSRAQTVRGQGSAVLHSRRGCQRWAYGFCGRTYPDVGQTERTVSVSSSSSPSASLINRVTYTPISRARAPESSAPETRSIRVRRSTTACTEPPCIRVRVRPCRINARTVTTTG